MAVNSSTLQIKFTTDGAGNVRAELGGVSATIATVDKNASLAAATLGKMKGALAGLVGSATLGYIVNTTVEFQRLSAALVTVTGSSAVADREFAKLRKFAETTPFQLNQVVDSFIKLKARGLDPTEATLRSFGNTASATGKSLDQFIEAVADAATGQMERLREFGITAKQEGAKVSFTFQGITETVGRNADDIVAYLQKIGDVNFAGAMDREAQTLGGSISNVMDAVAGLASSLGNALTPSLVATAAEVKKSVEDLSVFIRAIERAKDLNKNWFEELDIPGSGMVGWLSKANAELEKMSGVDFSAWLDPMNASAHVLDEVVERTTAWQRAFEGSGKAVRETTAALADLEGKRTAVTQGIAEMNKVLSDGYVAKVYPEQFAAARVELIQLLLQLDQMDAKIAGAKQNRTGAILDPYIQGAKQWIEAQEKAYVAKHAMSDAVRELIADLAKETAAIGLSKSATLEMQKAQWLSITTNETEREGLGAFIDALIAKTRATETVTAADKRNAEASRATAKSQREAAAAAELREKEMAALTAQIIAANAAEREYQNALQSLIEELDPSARALSEFREQFLLVQEAMGAGDLSAEQAAAMIEALQARYSNALRGIHEANNAETRRAVEESMSDTTRIALDAAQTMGDGIAEWIGNGFEGGSDIAKDIFSNLLKDILRMIIQQKLVIPIQASILQGAGFNGSQITSLLGSAGGGGGWQGDMSQGPTQGYGGGAAGIGGFFSRMFGGGAAGASSGAAGAAGGAGGMASAIPIIGWIYAGMQMAGNLYDRGWDINGQRNEVAAGTLATGDMGLVISAAMTNVLDRTLRSIGLSDKWASMLSGSSLLAAVFGRKKPEITGTGIAGSYGIGGFSGNEYANIHQRGGLFRSDRNWTETQPLQSEIDEFFDAAIDQVADSARRLSAAFGVDIDEALAGVRIDADLVLDKDPDKARAQIEAYADTLQDEMSAAVLRAFDFGGLIAGGEDASTMLNSVSLGMAALGISSNTASDLMTEAQREMLADVAVYLADVEDQQQRIAEAGGIRSIIRMIEDTDDTIAVLSGDTLAQLRVAIANVDDAVTETKQQMVDALAGGSAAEIAQAAAAAQQAVIRRYQAEIEMVEQLAAAIENSERAMRSFSYSMAQRIAGVGGPQSAVLDVATANVAATRDGVLNARDTEQALRHLDEFVAAVDAWLQQSRAAVQAWYNEQAAALQSQLVALDAEQAGILSAAQLRAEMEAQFAQQWQQQQQEALEAQRRALEEQLRIAQAWVGVLESADDLIHQLTQSSANPMSGFGRMALLDADIANLQQQFAAGGSPEVAEQLMQLLQERLQLAGELFDRPSGEYLAIYNNTLAELAAIREAAVGPAELAAQLQAELNALQQGTTDAVNSFSSQTLQLTQEEQVRLDEIEADRERIAEEQRLLDEEAAARMAAIDEEARAYYVWAQTEGLRLQQENHDAMVAQLEMLTGGLPIDEFIAMKQAEAVELLAAIRDDLAAFMALLADNVAGNGSGGVVVNPGGGNNGGGGGGDQPDYPDHPPRYMPRGNSFTTLDVPIQLNIDGRAMAHTVVSIVVDNAGKVAPALRRAARVA